MKKSKIYSVVLIVTLIAFILSVSIAIPIVFRPFYYIQISLLNLVEKTGYSYETIKTAYDEMMDFCTGLTSTFSTGELAYSADGMSHFVDVKYLFLLDFMVAGASIVILTVCYFLHKNKKVEAYHFRNHNCGFYASVILLVVFGIVGFFIMTDFSNAFTIFHQIFFAGKDNWVFDPLYDEIIKVLPETFFMNCAILIVVLIIAACIWLLVRDRKERLHLA